MNEPWLDEIRQTMTDYKEELPADGWERLSAAKPARWVVPIWLSRAAAVLLLGMLGVGGMYYFSDVPMSVTVHQERTEVTKKQEIKTPADVTEVEPIAEKQETKSVWRAAKVMAEPPEVAAEIYAEKEEADIEPQVREESLPPASDEEQKVLLAMESHPRSSKPVRRGWKIGMHLNGSGNTGEMSVSPENFIQNSNSGYTSSNTHRDGIIGSDNHLSWSTGVTVSKRLNDILALESGLVYTYLSSDIHMSMSGRKHQQLHYLGIPLRLGVFLYHGSRWQIYTSGGMMLEHSLYGKRGKENLHLNDWQYSLDGGVGLQFKIKDYMGLYVEPGMNYYFSNGSEVPSLRTESPLSFRLQLGLRFSL